MSRDVEMEISLKEMWLAAKKHWVLILLIALVFGVAGGAFGYWRLKSQQQAALEEQTAEEGEEEDTEEIGLSEEERSLRKLQRQLKTLEQKLEHEKAWYNEEKKMADDYEPINNGVADKLRAEWSRLIKLTQEHPFMKMDPNNCTWMRITLRFEPDSGSHSGTLSDWINGISDAALFGSAHRELSEYRADLISVDDRDSENSISLTQVDGFDINKAAKTIVNHIKAVAKANDVKIPGTSSSRYTGRLQRVFDYQLNIVTQLKDVQDKLSDIKSTESSFSGLVKPEDREEFQEMDDLKDQIAAQEKVVEDKKAEQEKMEADEKAHAVLPGISKSSLIKYGLIGLLLGIFVGAGLIVFVTIMRGRLISRRQVEDTFNLELLGDCSKAAAGRKAAAASGGKPAGSSGGKASDGSGRKATTGSDRKTDGSEPAAVSDGVSVLNANLDVMIGEGGKAMLLTTEGGDELDDIVARWNKKSNREFIAGRDLMDDSATIDSLQEVDGIILGIRVGETKVADVQKLLLRVYKLDKKVLGYVEI